MDTDSFVIYIKIEDFYKDIADDVEKYFDTSNYNKKMIKDLFQLLRKKIRGLFKEELNGNIMKKFIAPRAKTLAYLMEDDKEYKKAKGTKKCVIKCQLMFENYKNCVLNDKIILKKTASI